MSDESQGSMKRVKIALLVAAAIVICLGIAVVFAYLKYFMTISLEIVEPRGAVVQCDFVINSQAQSRRDTVPVTLEFPAYVKTVRFAVIPEAATSGNVDLRIRAGNQQGNLVGAGVRGDAAVTPTGGRVSIESMTDQHVQNMRRARTAPPNDDPSPTAR